MSHYILVADEMGTPGMAHGTSNTFVFGGYVVHETDVPQAVEAWRKIRLEMCDNADVELKWKHFFIEPNHPHISNPLSVTSTDARRLLAVLALDHLFLNAPIIPVVAISRKDRATDFFIVPSSKGKDKIDDDLMWLGPVSLFALFLDVRKAKGEMWFDKLGSEKHQERRQAAWSEQLRMVKAQEHPPELRDNFRKMLAIDEKIRFLDSEENDAVQIADFVCGVIWQAGEGDETFLGMLVDKYGPNASRQGLGILHIG